MTESADGLDGCATCGLVSRRDFLAATGIAAALAALAACSATDSTSPTISTPGSVRVADHPALGSVGGVALVTIDRAQIAIVRTGASSYLALSRVCPHQGATVNTSASGFLCPNHGARFDNNGLWIGGERTSNMHAYSTSFDAATGVLTISN